MMRAKQSKLERTLQLLLDSAVLADVVAYTCSFSAILYKLAGIDEGSKTQVRLCVRIMLVQPGSVIILKMCLE